MQLFYEHLNTFHHYPNKLKAILLCLSQLFLFATATFAQPGQRSSENIFRNDNLVAWCIVPFDSQKRSPQQRTEMLEKMGIRKLAYDYRAEHVPQFDEEIEQLKKHSIELTAWWFPTQLNDEAKLILRTLERHGVKTQLWVTGSGTATNSPTEQRERIVAEANRIRPIAEAAAKIGCSVALYNHGGWFGEPENQLAIIEELKLSNVGIVYNLHHGHDHLNRFPELLAKMKPSLMALNLNGMIPRGDQIGQKIVPLGAGSLDGQLLKTIRESGYHGPIGILNHTDNDAEARLLDNLDGLRWLEKQLDGTAPQESPKYRTYSPPEKTPKEKGTAALNGGQVLDGHSKYRQPPITVLCNATLTQQSTYNILVACDTKASGEHWELFTQAGTGKLTAFLPGYQPDHVATEVNLCDHKSHEVGMIFESNRIRLLVDNKVVGDQAVERNDKAAVAGGFSIGRLVEGGLLCYGTIDSVHVLRGAAEVTKLGEPKYRESLEKLATFQFGEGSQTKAGSNPTTSETKSAPSSYDAAAIQALAADLAQGNAARGVALFASAKSACLSCHKIGEHGGRVGPELTRIGVDRSPQQLAESLLWPNQTVEEKYRVHQVLTKEGEQVRGYLVRENDQAVTLRDPSTLEERSFAVESIAAIRSLPSLMPEGLANNWTRPQQLDMLAYLADLGKHKELRAELAASVLEHAQAHDPTTFPLDRLPINKDAWPNWQAHINRDRIYDFYTKEANYFRTQAREARLLMEFPGVDGGVDGHWGNQNEQTWASNAWNSTLLGSVQSGVFRSTNKLTVPRAVCLQLGEPGELNACFDPDTLTYPALWSGEFLAFSTVRHGFMDGVKPKGTMLSTPEDAKLTVADKPNSKKEYLGFYRIGRRVVFVYRVDGIEYLDAPWVKAGKFSREVAPRDQHSMRDQLNSAPPQWTERLKTAAKFGDGRPYAVDTFELPENNPWKALLFCGGHDFLADGSALVATIQGDVWHVSGLAKDNQVSEAREVVWRRFASGLNHALGLKIDKDGIFVLGRDQLTRLHDLNKDGEADYYECFSNAFETSPAGHDFICGLERDSSGNFFTASGNQGLVSISPDGKIATVRAEGFRNPDGLGIYPDAVVTVPCSEGEWTPATMICAVPTSRSEAQVPFYGYRGARFSQRQIERPNLPLVYLPRGLDNSAGGQTYVDSDRWGPLKGNMVHLSFGTSSHFLLLRDEVNGQLQAAVVPLVGDFLSGAHRGRFSKTDGQLYVSGMAGWGNYSPNRGCFQRVRYTGDRVMVPIGFHLHENGIAVRFPEKLTSSVCTQAAEHFAQAWNYRYSGAYGSAEYSAQHYGVRGHDRLAIASSHVLEDGRTLFLEIPELQPCNQLHLQIATDTDQRVDMFVTCHSLDKPRLDFPNPSREVKALRPHPIETDMLLATKTVKNPWLAKIADARPLRVEAGKNLSFVQRTLTAKAGEAVALTLANPDVVPHNWALLQPGKLQAVGEEANRLVADPEALVRQYVPQTNDVLCYTDIVEPHSEFTIHFRAPSQPGRYPYLCTFPGHWMVMNGELIVE